MNISKESRSLFNKRVSIPKTQCKKQKVTLTPKNVPKIVEEQIVSTSSRKEIISIEVDTPDQAILCIEKDLDLRFVKHVCIVTSQVETNRIYGIKSRKAIYRICKTTKSFYNDYIENGGIVVADFDKDKYCNRAEIFYIVYSTVSEETVNRYIEKAHLNSSLGSCTVFLTIKIKNCFE